MTLRCDGWSRSCVLSILLALPALCLSSTTVHAQLQWKTLRIETRATAGDHEVMAEFPFTNTSSESITILGVETSCACTTAVSSAETIAPNQTGSVRAVFALDDRVGRQEKIITVTTSDSPSAPTNLTLQVIIKEVLASTPRILMWTIDEPATEKVLVINPVAPYRIRRIDPPAIPPGFSGRLEQDEDQQRFLLHITPASTRISATAIIPLVVEVDGRPTVSHAVYALVK